MYSNYLLGACPGKAISVSTKVFLKLGVVVSTLYQLFHYSQVAAEAQLINEKAEGSIITFEETIEAMKCKMSTKDKLMGSKMNYKKNCCLLK